jgi:hypothetical protein
MPKLLHFIHSRVKGFLPNHSKPITRVSSKNGEIIAKTLALGRGLSEDSIRRDLRELA